MAEKRRDSKNRVLKTGESQRKDGRYMYKYTDVDGKVKYEYSWKLVPTDKMPAGKKEEPCLRDKIKEVEKRLESGVSARGAKMTVLELVEESMEAKTVRPTTEKSYRTMIRAHVASDPIAGILAREVRRIDAKQYVERLVQKQSGWGMVRNVTMLLIAAYNYGVSEEIVSRNPFTKITKGYTYTPSRNVDALTSAEKKSFMEAINKHVRYREYADVVELLFETGLRISELCGLTLDNISLKKKVIHVRQQYISSCGEISELKTNASFRDIPLNDAAHACIVRLMKKRYNAVFDMTQERFLLLTKKGKPFTAGAWESRFQAMSKKWMEIEPDTARQVTPHICRHTYCTELVQRGVNPKAVQYLMGHSQISITLNVYANNNTFDAAFEELKKKQII